MGTTIDRDLAIQTYCLRGYSDTHAVAQKVTDLGLTTIEMAGMHAGDAAPFRAAGIRIISCGVIKLEGDDAQMHARLHAAHELGVELVSVDFAPALDADALHTAERVADGLGMRLALHNHGGGHWLGSPQMLEYVLDTAGPTIGLMLDTAWAIDARADPAELARDFADRLLGVHIKDFIYERSREPVDVVIGTGNLDLPAFVSVLSRTGFSGPLILEYEGDIDDPMPALAECVQAVRQFW